MRVGNYYIEILTSVMLVKYSILEAPEALCYPMLSCVMLGYIHFRGTRSHVLSNVILCYIRIYLNITQDNTR